MDISTLLTSQSAPAQGALSIGGGQLGGSRVNGAAGEDAVDRFNQLLSNFLTVTGEDGLVLDGEAGVDGAGLTGLTLTGTAAGSNGTGVTIAVPQGLRGLALAAGNGKAGATDGRWTQAGLNLLATGGLQGQELNEEVVAFLNDLSAALGNPDGLASAGTPAALAAPAEEDAKGGIADALSLMQGEGAVPTLTPAVSPTNTVTISVIPQLQANAAPSALGVPMLADGTGAALDSVPQGDALPAVPITAAKVIPKLDKFVDAPAMAAVNTGIVGPQVAGAAEAPVTGNDPLLPATEPVVPPVATAATAATAGTTIGTTGPAPSSQAQAMAAPTVDTPQPPGAIALPQGMQAPTEPVKAAVPKLADRPTGTPVQQNSAADGQTARQAADGQTDASVIDLASPAGQKSPSIKAGSAPPEPAPALTASTAPASAPTTATTPAPAAATAATADPAAGVVLPMTAKPAPGKVASPAQAVTTAAAMTAPPPAAEPTPSTGDQAEPSVIVAADDATAQAAVAARTTVTTGNAATGRMEKSAAKVASATMSAPATTAEASAAADPEVAANPSTDEQTEAKGPERKAAASPKTAVTAKDEPADDNVAASDVPVAELSTSTDKVEDEGVTNRRMLAPKHVKEGDDGQARAELAGAAQTAGQNTTGSRPDPMPVAALTAAARGDSLLTRAVSASAKAEGSGSSTDAAALISTDSSSSAEQAALAMATADGSKPGATDFAQSLRQAASPHRPTAYTPPAMQVAVQVQQAAEDGNDRVSIQLTPHDLGKIEVQLEFGAGGKLRAKVMAENPQTLEMLQKDAKGLEKALQDAGLNTDANSLSFSLQQDNGDQAQQRQQGQDGSNYGTALASDDAEEEDPAIIAQAQIMELGRVDVRV